MLIDLYSKSSRSSRIALMAAFAIIATIASYDKFIAPHVQCLEASQRYFDEVGRFSQKSRVLEAKLKIQQLGINKLEAQKAKMQEQIFTPSAAQQFFAGLELIATENNCFVTSLNQLGSKPEPDKNKQTASAGILAERVSISILGDYTNILHFLKQVLERPNKVIINPFTITTRQDDSETLECSLIITIYVTDDEKGKGADPNAQ